MSQREYDSSESPQEFHDSLEYQPQTPSPQRTPRAAQAAAANRVNTPRSQPRSRANETLTVPAAEASTTSPVQAGSTPSPRRTRKRPIENWVERTPSPPRSPGMYGRGVMLPPPPQDTIRRNVSAQTRIAAITTNALTPAEQDALRQENAYLRRMVDGVGLNCPEINCTRIFPAHRVHDLIDHFNDTHGPPPRVRCPFCTATFAWFDPDVVAEQNPVAEHVMGAHPHWVLGMAHSLGLVASPEATPSPPVNNRGTGPAGQTGTREFGNDLTSQLTGLPSSSSSSPLFPPGGDESIFTSTPRRPGPHAATPWASFYQDNSESDEPEGNDDPNKENITPPPGVTASHFPSPQVDIHEDTRLESPRDDDGDDEEDDWEDLDDDSTPPSQQRPPEATVWNPINKSSAAAAHARKAARDLQAALAMSFEQLSSPARAPPSAVPAPTTSTRVRRPQPRRTLSSSSSGHSGIFADPVSAAEEDDGSATEEETDVERLESTGRLSSGNNTLSSPAAVVPTVEQAETFQTGSPTPAAAAAAGTEAIGRDDPRFEALIIHSQKKMKEADDVRRRRARQESSTTTTAAAAATTTTTRKIKETPVPLPQIPPPRRSVTFSVPSTPPSATRTGKRKQPTPQQQQQQAQSTNNNSYSSPVPQTPPSPTEKAKGKRRRLSPETPPQVPEKMMTVEEWRAEQEAEESRAMGEAIRRSLLVENARKGYHGQEKNGSPSSRAAAYASGTTSNVQTQAVEEEEEEEEMDAVSRQLIEEQQAMYDKLEEEARRNQNKKKTDKPTPQSTAGTKTQKEPEMAISFTFEERPSDVWDKNSTPSRSEDRANSEEEEAVPVPAPARSSSSPLSYHSHISEPTALEEQESPSPEPTTFGPSHSVRRPLPSPDWDAMGDESGMDVVLNPMVTGRSKRYYCSRCLRKAPIAADKSAGLSAQEQAAAHYDPNRCCKIRNAVGTIEFGLPNRSGWIPESEIKGYLTDLREEIKLRYPDLQRTMYPLDERDLNGSMWRSDPNNDDNEAAWDLSLSEAEEEIEHLEYELPPHEGSPLQLGGDDDEDSEAVDESSDEEEEQDPNEKDDSDSSSSTDDSDDGRGRGRGHGPPNKGPKDSDSDEPPPPPPPAPKGRGSAAARGKGKPASTAPPPPSPPPQPVRRQPPRRKKAIRSTETVSATAKSGQATTTTTTKGRKRTHAQIADDDDDTPPAKNESPAKRIASKLAAKHAAKRANADKAIEQGQDPDLYNRPSLINQSLAKEGHILFQCKKPDCKLNHEAEALFRRELELEKQLEELLGSDDDDGEEISENSPPRHAVKKMIRRPSILETPASQARSFREDFEKAKRNVEKSRRRKAVEAKRAELNQLQEEMAEWKPSEKGKNTQAGISKITPPSQKKHRHHHTKPSSGDLAYHSHISSDSASGDDIQPDFNDLATSSAKKRKVASIDPAYKPSKEDIAAEYTEDEEVTEKVQSPTKKQRKGGISPAKGTPVKKVTKKQAAVKQ